VSLVACGGGGGDDDDDDDDGATIDAGDDADEADAMPTASGVGQTCDPADATSCPADHACLAAMNFTNPWCSKTCTNAGMPGGACADGYDGPGLVGCFIQITGPIEGTFCGVVCEAPDGQCPSATCNGQCPGDLVCGTPDMNGVAICL
jgi:hypothetical protein